MKEALALSWPWAPALITGATLTDGATSRTVRTNGLLKVVVPFLVTSKVAV